MTYWGYMVEDELEKIQGRNEKSVAARRSHRLKQILSDKPLEHDTKSFSSPTPTKILRR